MSNFNFPFQFSEEIKKWDHDTKFSFPSNQKYKIVSEGTAIIVFYCDNNLIKFKFEAKEILEDVVTRREFALKDLLLSFNHYKDNQIKNILKVLVEKNILFVIN